MTVTAMFLLPWVAGAAAPAAPSAPSLTASTSSSLTVSWTAPPGTSPNITDYDYRYRIAGSATFTEVADTEITATEATVGGLQGSTRYEVQIRALNDDGAGAWSPSLTASTARLPLLGPGIGNVAWADDDLFKPISWLEDPPPLPQDLVRPERGGFFGFQVATLLNGWFVAPFAPDGGPGFGGIDVYDVSDPRDILLVKRIYDPDGRTAELREVHSLPAARIDDSIYVALPSTSGVEIWDFTDVNDIHPESRLRLPGVRGGDYTHVAWQTAWQAPWLYVASAGQGIFIVDASDPAAPVIANRGHRRPNPVPTVEYGGFRAGPLFAMGNHLVVTVPEAQPRWSSLDIGNPLNPVLLDKLANTDDVREYSVCFDGRRVYSARDLPVKPTQVGYDLSDPTSFAAVSGSLVAEERLYCATQDGFLFAGGQEDFRKIDPSSDPWTVVGTGNLDVSLPDAGAVTVMGNLVFVGNDHGTGSALFPHDSKKDVTAPRVVEVSPRDGAVNQPVSSRVGVAFSDSIQLRSVDATSVALVDEDGNPVGGTYSAQLGLVTLTPATPLKAFTTYTVTVYANGVLDYAGNRTATAFESTFTTAGAGPEPIHRWILADDAEDWYDRNDGTVAGARFASGGGLQLDGNGDWVLLEESLATVLKDDASVAFFLSTNQTGRAAATEAPGVTGRVDAGGSHDAYWGWLDDTGRLRLSFGDTAGIKSPEPVNDGTLHHYVLTRDVSTGRLAMYRDAVKIADGAGPAGEKTGGGDYGYLGAIQGSTRSLAGTLQEVQVFDNALSAVRVLQLYRKSDSGVTQSTLDAVGSAGVEMTFTAEPTGGSTTTYEWDFGDGSSSAASTSRTANHTYSNPGHYTVLLTVTFGDTELRYSFTHTVTHPRTPGAPSASTTIVGAKDHVYKVNPDNHTVTAIHRTSLNKVWETRVGKNPRTVAVDALGRVWVAVQGDDKLACLTSAGRACGAVETGHGSAPFGLAFVPGTNTGLVTLQGSGEVLRFDAATATVLSRGPVNAEPRGLAITGDGADAYVTRLRSTSAGLVTRIDASTLASISDISLRVDSTTVDAESRARGRPNYLTQIVISPDGRTAWVSSKQDNVLRGEKRDGQRLTHDSTVRAIASLIDVSRESELAERRIHFDDRAGAVAVAFSPRGDYVFAVLQGSDSVSIIDAYSGEIKGAMERGTGTAPDGIWIDESAGRAFVSCFTSRSVDVYDIAAALASVSFEPALVGKTNTVASEVLTSAELKGLRIFYNARDPRMSRDGYVSCASCHLGGGEDGAVWDFTQRGEGLRNTLALNGRKGAALGPLHWTANFDEIQDFEHDVRDEFGGTGFMTDSAFSAASSPLGPRKAGRSNDLDALAAYVSSLDDFGRSPHRTPTGALTAEAETGEALFGELGCGSCHSGTFFTDARRHDVGTISADSGAGSGSPLANVGFKTPTLLGVWRTPPYFHDGSAATLADVLDAQHGGERALTADERTALMAFLRALERPSALPPRPPSGGGGSPPSGGGGPPPGDDDDDDDPPPPPAPPPPPRPPTAAFSVEGAACDAELCRALTGEAVRFEDESAGTVRTRSWEFGDGRRSRFRAPRHSWSSPGFYEVTLLVSDGETPSTARRVFLVSSAAPAGTCVADGETVCLQDSRYSVTVDWRRSDGESGRGSVVHAGTNDSGLFRFFDRENWEVLVKVLDGCALNGHVWVFGASTTDLGYAIRVTDTVTGTVREYGNEPGTPAAAISDVTALPDCR